MLCPPFWNDVKELIYVARITIFYAWGERLDRPAQNILDAPCGLPTTIRMFLRMPPMHYACSARISTCRWI